MAEEEQTFTRVMRLALKCQWQTQELKLKRTKMPKVDGEDHSMCRRRLVRKCEFPNAEAAADIVDFLSSDACLDYLKLCRKELNTVIETKNDDGDVIESEFEWTPVQAWYTEEDATRGSARHGMLYHVLKEKGDDDTGDGPYVTTDGCKYVEEYTFYWDVDEPPELPKSSSGVQYSMDIKRRDDVEGLGGLYDCILVKRVTLQQNVDAYESHHELGETRVTAQALGVSDEAAYDEDGNRVDPENKPTIDEKIVAFAGEQGLQLEDGPAMKQAVDGDGNPQTDGNGNPVMVADYGVVVDISKEKNADCTTSVTIQNTKEEKNLRSTVVGEETIRSKRLTVVDENVAPDDDEGDDGYPFGTFGAGAVVRKTVTKTKGGVRVIQTETTEAKEVTDGSGTVVCEKTLFEHQHTSIAEGQSTTDADATDAGDGKTYRVQRTLRDDGKFDIQSTTTTENSVPGYVSRTVSGSGPSKVSETVDKNSVIQDTIVTPGVEDDWQGGYVITEKQKTKTPGGREDVRTVTRTPKRFIRKLSFAQNKTSRRNTTLHIMIFENCTLKDLEFAESGDTYTHSTYTDGSIRMNEYGLYDGQLQYYKITEVESGGSVETPTELGWAVTKQTKNSIAQFADNVWACKETWVEAVGYVRADIDDIYDKFKGICQDINVVPANRERTEWSVRLESPHYFEYKSILNSATRAVGTMPDESDYQWGAATE